MNPRLFWLVWLASGAIGLVLELVLYPLGRHKRAEEIRQLTFVNPGALLLLAMVVILLGPIQLATLAVSWHKPR